MTFLKNLTLLGCYDFFANVAVERLRDFNAERCDRWQKVKWGDPKMINRYMLYLNFFFFLIRIKPNKIKKKIHNYLLFM